MHKSFNAMKAMLVLVFIFLIYSHTTCQVYDSDQGCMVYNGECIPNIVYTAVPFLQITPDARSEALGDVGIATSATPNSLHFNASSLAFTDYDFDVSMSFMPPLPILGLSDIMQMHLAGYRKVGELQTVATSLRYFSLGFINTTDINVNPLKTRRATEIEVIGAYARKLSEKFSTGVSARYTYSEVYFVQLTVASPDNCPAKALSFDLSFTYETELGINDGASRLRIGTAISNIGPKIYFPLNQSSFFLPAKFGLGFGLDLKLATRHSLCFAMDFNKLMVPTFQARQIIENGVLKENPDYYDIRDLDVFPSILKSWSDAPGGFSEELSEWMVGTGLEYWNAKKYAVRCGYFYQARLKGAKQFYAFGIGTKISQVELDLSYRKPANNKNNPLDKTLRFTISLDIE